MKKDSLLAFALYTLLIVVFYAPVIFSGKSLQPPLYQPHGVVEGWAYNYDGRTPTSTFNIDLATPAYYEWPINKLVGDIYGNGELPLWNPYQGAGTPLASQYSSRVFFPFQILEDISPVWSWDFFILARLLLAGFFTYIFLTTTDLNFTPAFFGGALYMFSGSFTWFINLEQFVNSAMMIPVLLYALERMAHGKSGKWLALSGITTALVLLAGQPEVSLYILLLGACYYFFRCLYLADSDRLAIVISKFLVSTCLGLALASPLLIPFAEFTLNAHHIHHSGGTMGVQTPPPVEKAFGIFTPTTLALPMPPGEMAHSGGLSGEPFYFRFFPQNGEWDWLGGYSGLLPFFIIAVCFFLLLSRRRNRWRYPFFFFASFGLFILLKNFGFKPFVFLGYLPLFDQAWSPRWAGPTWTFSIAVAGAIAVQIFTEYHSGEPEEDADGRISPWQKATELYRTIFSREYIRLPVAYALTMWISIVLSFNSYKEWLRTVIGAPLLPEEKTLIKDSFIWSILIFVGLYLIITLLKNRRLQQLERLQYVALIAFHAILVNLFFLSGNRHVVIVQNLSIPLLITVTVVFFIIMQVFNGLRRHTLRLPFLDRIIALKEKPLLAGAIVVTTVYSYTAFLTFYAYFNSQMSDIVKPYFVPSVVIGTLVTLLLLFIAYCMLAYYIKNGKGLSGLFALAVLELWWAVPRGYNHYDLMLKPVPLVIGILAALSLTLNRKGVAIAGAVIFLASSIWVDSTATNGFPDRYDPFTKAPYVDFIKNRNDYGRVMGGEGVLYPNFASALGLWDVRYINALSPKIFQDFRSKYLHADVIAENTPSSLWFTGGKEYYITTPASSHATLVKRPVEEDLLKRHNNYSFLGVRYIVLPKGSDINAFVKEDNRHEKQSFPLIYDKEVNIFENNDALPRAFMVHDFDYAKNYEEAQQVFSSPDFDLGTRVMLEEEAPSWYKNLKRTETKSNVYIKEYGNNRVVIVADAEESGILVLTDTYYPGWKAYVDGRPAKIYRVNGLVRGVFLLKGEHTIIYKYLPASFLYGCALAALSILIFAVVSICVNTRRNARVRVMAG